MSTLSRLPSFTRILFLLVAVAWCQNAPRAFGQRAEAAPAFLKGPANWRFERLTIPPGFAPDIKWTGVEEARFAPGMFDPKATNYFTYLLAVSVEVAAPIGAPGLKEFLDQYYKGLSTAVGRGKAITPDAAHFDSKVTASKVEPGTTGRFTAIIPFVDTFTDGRKITLHMEIAVLPDPATKKTLLVMLVSPQAKDAPIWKELRAFGQTVEKR